MPTARSTPNIALIKYWGNRNDELRLCAADSISMTLDGPYVDVTVDHAERFALTSTTKQLTEKERARFAKTLELIKRYLATIDLADALPASLAIEIDSHIPQSIGLASSSAVFSAFAKAIAELIENSYGTAGRKPALGKLDGHSALTDEQISVMARLGSGSAARSIFGGYGAIRNLPGDGIGDAIGYQIAPETHWRLHDIIIVPSTEEKKVGSTEGHGKAGTSPHFLDRIAAIPRRIEECTDAILTKDFEKLQHVAEEDSMDMHHCMQTQNPPLNYLSTETMRIVREVESLRKAEHLPVLCTMDAGPTVHLFCEEEARERVLAYAKAQTKCALFEAKTGTGAQIVSW